MQAQCPTSGNVVVTTNANSGSNTLRWAIDCINAVTPLTTIVINIPAPGVQTINLTSSLPAITKPNAVIDGTAIESVVINGSLITAPGDGIVISASNVTVRGLRITGFNSASPGGAGIRISGDNAIVSDNFLYNNRAGIVIRDPIVAGAPSPVQSPLITGNSVGLNAAGGTAGNSSHGIHFENTPNSAIVSGNNTIAHNGGNGVRADVSGGTLLISLNSMFCNASGGIFRLLSPAAPTITEANTQRIRGTAAGNNLIEVFTYNSTGCAAGSPCQGRIVLGTTTANLLGFWTLNLSAGAVAPGTLVTATRTVGGNNTYAFATCSTVADCSGFSVSIAAVPIACNGNNNGQLTASAPGGSSTSYLWSTGATTPSISGLGPGTYSVTATDAAGCTATAMHTLSNPPPLTLGMSGTNVTCFGAANGTATATPAGGTPNYQYAWSNGGNTAAISNLVPGTYFVTVTDANLCRTFGNISITQPMALNISCAEQNPVSTVGGSDGRATVQIAGGTAGYTLAWSGAASGSQNQAAAGTAVVSGLVSGNYSLTVTDAAGCVQTCNFSIGSPNCNITLQISGTNPSCNGSANGSINLVVNGATGSLNFDWNINALDGLQNPTGLSAGAYSVTVTDAANCTASTSVTLTQPAALSISCGQQNPVSTVGGSDGRATVQIAGGTAGYTLAWSGAASGSQNQAAAGTAVVSGLVSGNYSLTVTDAAGCVQTCNFSIGSPNCNITLQISGTNPSCNGSANGSINLVVNGATGSLNFDWNVNALDGLQNPTGLSAGAYSVTVTDAANCTASTSVALTQPAALSISCGQQNPVSTVGGSDGRATVQIAGGTAGYTLAWSGAASGSQNQAAAGTAVVSGLVSGNYSLTVTDAAGCVQTCNFSIGSPNCNITLQISGTNPSCNGSTNGSINLVVNGATGSLNFDWNINALDGLQNPTGLSAGAYSVTVTDAANCTASTSVALTQPAALSISCGQQNPVSTVGGSDGRATVQIAGGTAGYTLAWSGAASGSQNQVAAGTAVVSGLVSGNYSLTVTDAAGCVQTCNFSIGSPNCNITLQISGTNPSCNGSANGSINLVVNGATGSLNFDWNINALDGLQNPTGLSAGAYSVTVTDAANCTASTSVTLTQPVALSISCGQQNPVSTVGGSDGRATVQIAGGTAGYTLAWSGAASGSQNQAAAGTAVVSGLVSGNYSLTVTDAAGCVQTCNFSIGSPTCNITLQISGTNPSCNGSTNGSINLVVNGATGSLNFDWNVNALDGLQNPTGLSAGAYSVTVTDAANCTASTSVTLTQPAALSISCGQQNPVSTVGGSDGRATVQIAGGTAGYTLAWSGAASGSQNQAAAGTAVVSGLVSGNYSLTVTDAAGCVQTCNFSIGSPNCNITLQISGTNPSCNGSANGSINLVVNGATGSLNFDWNVNALDGLQNPTGLSAGAYSVTVTDAANCTASNSINLTAPPALQLNMSTSPETAAGAHDGTATAISTGGTGSYTFAWSNGGNTPTISGLAPGNYTVTVTDGNLCTISGSTSVAAGSGGGGACVAQPVYAVAAPARVCQGDTIRIEADDLYPSPNVRYVWFIPNGDSVITVLPRVGIRAVSGAYGGQYFALRDSSGCRSIRVGGAPVQVQSLPDDAATIAMMDTVLCISGTVMLRALPASGGTGRWLSLGAATVDNAMSEQTNARNLQRGPNRFVWQVNLEGCNFSASDTVTVTVEAPPVVRDDRYTLQRVQDVLVMEVLLNDDLGGLPDTVLSFIGVPVAGQLELLDGRRFRYTVTEDFRGIVSFQYVVCNPGARCGAACDTATVTIDVLNLPAVPSGLIVNDPGANGQLKIKGLNGFSRVEIQIFSRWGDLVFEEKQYDNGNPWQGHAHRSGKPLPSGAYYYVLRAFDGNVQVGEAQRGVVHLFQ